MCGSVVDGGVALFRLRVSGFILFFVHIVLLFLFSSAAFTRRGVFLGR